jgi:hypothetical protein
VQVQQRQTAVTFGERQHQRGRITPELHPPPGHRVDPPVIDPRANDLDLTGAGVVRAGA